MGIKTFATNDRLLAGDLNYFVRDLKQNAVAIARADGTQIVSPLVETNVYCNEEDFDPDGMHSTTLSTHLFTPTYAGIYYLTGFVEFQSNASGFYRQVEIAVNGSTFFDQGKAHCIDVSTAAASFVNLTSVPTSLNGSTDNLAFSASHNATTTLTLHSSVIALCRFRT